MPTFVELPIISPDIIFVSEECQILNFSELFSSSLTLDHIEYIEVKFQNASLVTFHTKVAF